MKSPATVFVLAAVVSCLTQVSCHTPEAPEFVNPSKDVLVLTKDTFRDAIQPQPLMLVEFYAPWCPHCKKLEPEYEKAAKALKDDKLPLAKVDCDDEKELCQELRIPGYPTVKLFRNGHIDHDYDGAHDADAIVAYMRDQSRPALLDLTLETFEEFNKTEKVVVIGFLDKGESKERKALFALATKYRRKARFGVVDSSMAEKFGVKTPGLVLLKKFDEGKNVYDGEWNVKALESFFLPNSVPLVAELDGNDYADYAKSGLPLAYLFLETDEQRKPYDSAMKTVARELRGKMNFVFADVGTYGNHGESIGAGPKWPSFIIFDIESNLKYLLAADQEITETAIRDLAQQVLDGTAKPFLKSDPEPESNDGPVITVVGTTFEKIVMDPTKDVVMEFYAPWCGYCKKLAPIFDKLGEMYSGAKDIVIGKMDSTTNDLPAKSPFTVRGFPTIKFFKANSKEIVDYKGDRSLESFIEFISNNTISKFSVAVEPKPVHDEETKEKKSDEHDRDEL